MTFQRPNAFPFTDEGVNLRTTPEAIKPSQYACLLNVRGDSQTSLRTRPGYTSICSSKGNPILACRAYSTLSTDNLPRFLFYDSAGDLFLDNGVSIVNLTAPHGQGACLLPFRPNSSPQPWMYVSTLGDYRKFCAPDALDTVLYAKVGIAEPPAQLEFSPIAPAYTDINGLAIAWTPGGTAGGTGDGGRLNDTVAAIYADPVIATRYAIQLTLNSVCNVGELLTFTKSTGGTIQALVQDVVAPIPTGVGLTIQAIRYAAGATGRCTIVPSQISNPSSDYYLPQPIGTLRRGSLVTLKATETVLVLDVVLGPDGSQCFECVTAGTYAAGDAIDGVLSIIVDGISSLVTGQLVVSVSVGSTLTKGIGYIDRVTSPFNLQLDTSGKLPQIDDYIHLSFYASDYTAISEIKILLDIDPTTHDFQHNALYYSVDVSQLALAASNAITNTQALSNIAQVSSINQQISNLQSQIASMTEGNPNVQMTLDQITAFTAQAQALAATGPQIASAAQSSGTTTSGYAQWT